MCLLTQAVFTLYQIVKQSVAESMLDIGSVHTRNATFGTIFAPEQDYLTPLVKDVGPATQRSTCPLFILYQISFCNAPFHYPLQCEPSLKVQMT